MLLAEARCPDNVLSASVLLGTAQASTASLNAALCLESVALLGGLVISAYMCKAHGVDLQLLIISVESMMGFTYSAKVLHMSNVLPHSSVPHLCTGAMLHKRTAVAPHMPATAADMLLPSAAPILYHNPGSPLSCHGRSQFSLLLTCRCAVKLLSCPDFLV